MKYEAIALCRVSTSKQRLEGSSLKAQEVRVYECAEYLEAKIQKIWSLDTSSRKGKNIARKDLNEMHEFCKRHKRIRYIIVDEADRFMRSVEEGYWWKVEFMRIGVYLAFANMPEITHEDNPIAVMRVMMAFFQGEVSNHERITKTTDKMQAKIAAGYYPGVLMQGYQKSEIRGLHVPREPQWSLLKQSMHKILYEAFTLHEALKWLIDNNYEYSTRPLDMSKFKHILEDPYYAGIVRMSNWDVVNEHGLHQAMITKEEHEKLVQIVKGKGKKFTVRKDNPLFGMSNVGMCPECFPEHGSRAALVGYTHNNGKQGNARKYYDRYRCRVCNKAILKLVTHNGVDEFVNSVEFVEPKIDSLKRDLKKAWCEEMNDNTQAIARLKQKLGLLNNEKDNLVRTLASQPDLAEDIKSAIVKLKSDILTVESDIANAEGTDKDFEEFVDFSLSFVERMKDEWWDLERVDKQRCKQLLFPGEIFVARSGKVSTQELSKLIRYKNTPRADLVGAKYVDGGAGGTRTPDFSNVNAAL
jgi:site-specific DNA recombinase